jgi:hypothetical protein
MHNLPKAMRAVVLTGHGGLDKLEHRDGLADSFGHHRELRSKFAQ